MTVTLTGQMYKQIVDAIPDGFYVVDLHRDIMFWNKGAEEITGFTATDVLGQGCGHHILVHTDVCGEDMCNYSCPLVQAMESGNTDEGQLLIHHKDGYRLPVMTKTAPLKDEQGQIIGAVQFFRIPANRARFLEKMKELQHDALYDQLTDIGNRRYAEKFLQSRMQKLQLDEEYSFAVALYDIDNFKTINDQLGHDAGDKVLRMVARTLENNVRPEDMTCRWGGEEFLVIFHGVNDVDQLRIASDRLRILVEKSFILLPDNGDQKKIAVTVSGGGTVVKSGEDTESVLKRVDDLLYRSKAEGKNRITIG